MGRTIRVMPTNQVSNRYAERRQQIYKHFGHEFVAKVFKLPTFCAVCSEFLWYFYLIRNSHNINLPSFFSRGFSYKGFQCQRCDCVVHQTCYSRFACPCKGKKYPEVSLIPC